MTAVVSLAPVALAGQAQTATADTRTPPRTPWGEPDLQGIWDYCTLTPLQRPGELAGKEFLTEEEVAEREATERDRGISATPSFGTQIFDRPTTLTEDRQTSLIVAEEPFWHDHHRLIGSENGRVGSFGWPTTTEEQRVTKDQRKH